MINKFLIRLYYLTKRAYHYLYWYYLLQLTLFAIATLLMNIIFQVCWSFGYVCVVECVYCILNKHEYSKNKEDSVRASQKKGSWIQLELGQLCS